MTQIPLRDQHGAVQRLLCVKSLAVCQKYSTCPLNYYEYQTQINTVTKHSLMNVTAR